MTNELRAEEQLNSDSVEQRTNRFLSILENTSDIVYACDVDGNFIYVNKAAEDHTGYSSAELLKMNLRKILTAESLEQVERLFTRRPVSDSDDSILTIDIVRKDGKHVALEMKSWWRIVGGARRELQGIARDISHRRRLETELKEAERRYRGLVQSSQGLICTHDLQ